MEITNEAIEYIKSKVIMPNTPISKAYEMGYDCGKNGATLANCHFTLFSSVENTLAWSTGKADAEAGRENKYTLTSPSDGAKTTNS